MLSNTRHSDDEEVSVAERRASGDDGLSAQSATRMRSEFEEGGERDARMEGPSTSVVSIDESRAEARTTVTSRPTGSRALGPRSLALAHELAGEAVADAHGLGGSLGGGGAASLSTAPAQGGVPFYPTASTHVRLSLFTTQGPTDAWAALVVGLLCLVIFIWGTVTLATFHANQYSHLSASYVEARRIHKYGDVAVVVNLQVSLLAMAVLISAVLFVPQYALMGLASLGTVLLLIATIIVLVKIHFIGAIALLGVAFLQFFYAFLNRHTLMRCTEALRAVGLVWKTYPAVLVAAVGISLAAHVFALLWAGVLLPYAISLVSNSSSFIELFVLWIFLMLLAWFVNIFPCLLSIIVGGVTATWYALEGDPAGTRSSGGASSSPALYTNLNPTFWMSVRAVWTNAGTGCLAAALSVQSSWWHWLAEGLSEVTCLARCTCWEDCMRSITTLSDMAYRSFNGYALMRVSINGDKFICAGLRGFQVVSNCRDLAYFRHRLHVLTPLMVLYAVSTSLFMMTIFGSLSWSLGCYSCISVGMAVHTFGTVVHHTWRALLYCDAVDRQPMSVAAPALQLEIDSVREDGEQRFTAQAAAQAEPVIV